MESSDVILIGLTGVGLLALYTYMNEQNAQPIPSDFPNAAPPTPMPAPINYVPPPQTYYPPAPQSPLIVSASGEEFIKSNEGLRLTPYIDGTGHSIGYGHYIAPGTHIPSSITQQQADTYFLNDLANTEATVQSLVRVPLTQDQFDALADFVFTVGRPKFSTSTLLRLLNANDYAGAASQLLVWKTPLSIFPRRQREMALFSQGLSGA